MADGPIRVVVRYFAVLKEQRGRESEELTVPTGTTVAALYAELFPPGRHGRLPVAYARNATYARADEVLQDGDEVAFLPPVGGG